MAYTGLRQWLDRVQEHGELRVLDGAHWNLEIGAITDMVCHRSGGPAVIFDNIPGYPAGYRVAVNLLGTPARLGLTLGVENQDSLELVQSWRKKMRQLPLIPPAEVTTGPVLENVITGEEVNLLAFPTPLWNDLDGGRYLGTGSVLITRDPDEGWVNLGTYRGMIQGRDKLGFYLDPGKHARVHREKYWAQGKPCPVAVVFGCDPRLFLFASIQMPEGISEYEWAGGLAGNPVPVIRGEFTGLPIPADAEIVIEGEAYPDQEMQEGPFGEWTGYYGSSVRAEPYIVVRRVLFRNNPIIHGHPPMKPPSALTYWRSIVKSAEIWNSLEEAGVPDVHGVWCHEAGATRFFNVVAIKQRYPGHARQAGLIASQCSEGVRVGRYVVVVDEDINPADLGEVIWAMSTRTDPVDSIDIIRNCMSSPLDPIQPPGKVTTSRAVIDACRPYLWKHEFPPVIEVNRDRLQQAVAKWGAQLFD